MILRKLLFTYRSIILGCLILITSCKPVIYNFDVKPLTIEAGDTIQISWKVSGKAILMIHDHRMQGDSSLILRDLTLVVRKNNQELPRKIQVAILPDKVNDVIIFRTALKGDTLIADGINNNQRWGDAFVICSVKNTSKRSLDVHHAGKTKYLEPYSVPDSTFRNTPIGGKWEFRTLLSASEKRDHTIIPDNLSLQIKIQHHAYVSTKH